MGKGLVILKSVVLAALFFASLAVAAVGNRLPATNPSSYTNEADIFRQLPTLTAIQNSQAGGAQAMAPNLWVGSVHWTRSKDAWAYKIDETLKPSIIHNFAFTIFPQMIYTGKKPRNVDDGYYMMRMVVLRPLTTEEEARINSQYGDDAPSYLLYRRFISFTEQVIRVENGSIRADVRMEFPSVATLSMRNTLLIQLLPVNPKSLARNADGKLSRQSKIEVLADPSFAANIISMPFVPREGRDYFSPPTRVFSDEVTLEEKLDLGSFARLAKVDWDSRLAQLPRITDPQDLAQRRNFNYLTTNGNELRALADSPFLSLQKGPSIDQLIGLVGDSETAGLSLDESYAPLICNLLINNLKIEHEFIKRLRADPRTTVTSRRAAAIGQCVSDPEGAFEVIKTWHVQSVDRNSSQGVRGAHNNLTLSFNFGSNRQRAVDVVNSLGVGGNILGVLPVDLKGMIGLNYNTGITHSSSRSKFEGMTLNSSANLVVDEWDVKFDITESTPCLLIQPNFRHSAWVAVSPSDQKGLYICSPYSDKRRITAVETFFHILPPPGATSSIDPYHPNNQLANMVLRGPRDFFSFYRSVRDMVVPYKRDGTVATELQKTAGQYRTLLPASRSLFTAKVALTGKRVDELRRRFENPGFFDRLVHQRTETFD